MVEDSQVKESVEVNFTMPILVEIQKKSFSKSDSKVSESLDSVLSNRKIKVTNGMSRSICESLDSPLLEDIKSPIKLLEDTSRFKN